jgi:hypothetical protein
MYHVIARSLAALLLLGSASCASSFVDPTGRLTSLEETQHRYTQLVRWGELRRAAAFVEPELVEEFIGYEKYFEQIRITDVDEEEVILDPSQDSASVEVTYHAYSYRTFEEKRFSETQNWTRYDGVKNVWLVRPELKQIVEAFHAKAE